MEDQKPEKNIDNKNLENSSENVVIDENGKELKPKKINFFKKVWYSIFKFEKYVEMSLEGAGRALKYLVQIVSVFVLIISCIGLYNTNQNLNKFVKNIEANVPDFRYSDGKIELAEGVENKVYTIDDEHLNFGKIIVDLNTEDESVISEYENTIKNDSKTGNNGFIVLKDKAIQVTKISEGVEGESRVSLTYGELMQNLFGSEDVKISKDNLLQFLNGNGRTSIFIVNFFSYFIAYFIIYITSGLIYTLVLALIGFVSAKITKLSFSFPQLFSMSVYAFTLSNVLNAIYFIVNYFAGITITYFDVAYIAIAYIYLITVLFLIKTDFLRKQEKKDKEEKKEKEETDGQEQI